MSLQPFHLAVPVHDLAAARAFYGDLLGFPEGRSSDHWIDFDFFGHQLVVHLKDDGNGSASKSDVDGHNVPIPHFGVVLTPDQFETLASRVSSAGITFGLPPQIRFKGQPGEQSTMFFCDPSGNALEFKAFKYPAQLFER